MCTVDGSPGPRLGNTVTFLCKYTHFCPWQHEAPSTFFICERAAQILFVFPRRKKIIQSWNDILTDFHYSFTDALWPAQQHECFRGS